MGGGAGFVRLGFAVFAEATALRRSFRSGQAGSGVGLTLSATVFRVVATIYVGGSSNFGRRRALSVYVMPFAGGKIRRDQGAGDAGFAPGTAGGS